MGRRVEDGRRVRGHVSTGSVRCTGRVRAG